MAKLKPCPFCGGIADVMNNENETVNYRAFGYGTRGYATWYICYCKECGATGQTAIDAWNRRLESEVQNDG